MIVDHGMVQLWAEVSSAWEKEALLVATETVPGVRSVEAHVALSGHNYGI